MLDTPKLLYVLPDVSYVVELVAGKKEHTFTVHSFRQINGEFLTDEELVAANVAKLFQKLEEDTYHLILPDFLFTNTIVNISETQDSKITAHIKNNLLPSLGLTTESHEIATFVLTQYNNQTRVQLSAIEKSALSPLRVSAHQNKVRISAVSPLSWTLKSVISLEPSISIVQMGTQLYSALQYIGVDQTYQAALSDVANISDTIRTLKGAEPSIQTVYLLTNSLVEEKLKEQLSNTLPLQQLAVFDESDTQMPSYVRQVIESGMKTLSIADYPVPKFNLGSPSPTELNAPQTDSKVESAEDIEKKPDQPKKPEIRPLSLDEDTSEPQQDMLKENSTMNSTSPLPTPVPPTMTPPVPPVVPPAPVVTPAPVAQPVVVSAPVTPPVIPVSTPVVPTAEVSTPAPQVSQPVIATPVIQPPAEPALAPQPSVTLSTQPSMVTQPVQSQASDTTIHIPEAAPQLHEPSNGVTSDVVPTNAVVLPQSAELEMHDTSPHDGHDMSVHSHATPAEDTIDSLLAETQVSGEIVPHDSNYGSLFKMLLVMFGAFALTVASGIAITLGIINFSQPSGDPVTPVAQQESPTPPPTPVATPEPTPEASPAAAVDLSKVSVLIVNATPKAGYAGQTKSKLDKAGVKQTKATNAKEKYEPGMYILLDSENSELVAKLTEVTGLDLQVDTENKKKEDTAGSFTAVIVLGE